MFAAVSVTGVDDLRILFARTVSPGTPRTWPATIYAPGLNPEVFQGRVTVKFAAGVRLVKFFIPTVRSPAIAMIDEFSDKVPRFCTTMVMVTVDPTVAEVGLEETEYTARSCGDVVVVMTIVTVTL